MTIGHYTDVRKEASPMPGAQATIRWLIAEKDGAVNFAMRVIELERKGDRIPLHGHSYEHEVFVLAGQGNALAPAGPRPVRPGDFIFVPADEQHGFENTGAEPFRFICVIPVQKK